MSIIQGTSKASGGGYEIDQSIRFNDNDAAYMSRTSGTPTSTTIFTISLWFKRSLLTSSAPTLINEYSGNSDAAYLNMRLQADDTLNVSGYATNWRTTTRLFRDPSAWYHFVLAVDTNQGTAANRIKLYINGVQETSFSANSNPGSGTTLGFNTGGAQNIGRINPSIGGTNYFDGYMAEFNFIDGLALAPTSFGETNDDGVWIAKAYDAAYGDNGFYITGEDSADLGEDFSGNNNDFTSSGLTTADQVTDTPTENYATLSPISGGAGTLSNGNLALTGNDQGRLATFAIPLSGKWAFKVTMTTAPGGSVPIIGLSTIDGPLNGSGSSAEYRGYRSDGNKISASVASYGDTFTSGEVIEVLANMDDGELTFINEGVSQGVAFTDLVSSGEVWFPNVNGLNGSCVFNLDFGQLGYTPPTGYKTLNTANLPTPTIADGSTAFQTTLYTATGSALEVNQVGNSTFQPDFVWVKNRTSASGQMINDAVTGAQKFIRADSTAGQTTQAQGLVSFDADGFSVGTNGDFNYGTDSFVGWQWLAGNGTATNEVGTITSTVSVNTTAGFSIVRAASMAGSGGTIGHGLGTVPDMVIGRMQSEVFNWWVWHQGLTGGTYHVKLNDTSAQAAAMSVYSALPTSTLINTGGSWTNGNPAFFYVFTGVEGYSKFGKYNGNGSTDGSFIYTGFKPAFVISKRIDSADNWAMYDATRDPYNVAEKYLLADTNAAETTYSTAKVDFLSNGFKWRGAVNFGNNSGGTYIYMAFAENPFGGDGVAPATAR